MDEVWRVGASGLARWDALCHTWIDTPEICETIASCETVRWLCKKDTVDYWVAEN